MNANLLLRETCPVCGSRNAKTIFSRSFDEALVRQYMNVAYQGNADISFLEDADYTIVKCRECKLAYQNSALAEEKSHELYEKWIDPLLAQEWNDKEKTEKRHHYRRILSIAGRQIHKRIEEIRVLDFGAGFGDSLLVATEMGFNCYAYEYSTKRIEILKRKGIKTIAGKDEMQFDIIICDQVLEHVSLPSEILDAVTTFLHRKGVMYVSVPNCRHTERLLKRTGGATDGRELQRRLLDASVSAFQHINCFRHSNLIMLLKKHGLRTISPLKQIENALRVKSVLRPFYNQCFGTSCLVRMDEKRATV